MKVLFILLILLVIKMDFSNKLKIQIIKTVTKLVQYEVSFTTGTVIDLINKGGYWPKDVNKVNAYYRVQQIIEDTLINLDYDSYTDEMVTIYVPKRVKKEIQKMLEEPIKMTPDEMIEETLKHIIIDNNYEFKLPKFNQFWNHGWEKFF